MKSKLYIQICTSTLDTGLLGASNSAKAGRHVPLPLAKSAHQISFPIGVFVELQEGLCPLERLVDILWTGGAVLVSWVQADFGIPSPWHG